MNSPLIAPHRVKWDLRFLFPDLRRPGGILRLRSRHTHECMDVAEVVQRVETELAGAALRYRMMLWVTAGVFLSPALLAWAAWDLLWRKTPAGLYILPPYQYEPFVRGFYFPNVSLYEFATYCSVFLLMGAALFLSYLTFAAMYRLAPDYQFLRDADEAQRAEVVRTASDGRWPRATALLLRGREFAEYRPLVEQSLSASGVHGPSAPALKVPALSPAPWDTRTAMASALALIAVILTAGIATSAIRRAELGRDATTLAVGGILLGTYCVILAFLWWLARREGHGSWDAFGLRREAVFEALGVGLAVALIARLGVGLWGMVLRIADVNLPGSDLDPARLLPSGTAGVVLTLVTAVILAPLVEEMVFRGMLLDAMRRQWGDRIGVYGSSLIFAAVHVSAYALPPIFVLSIVLSRLYIRRQTLWASVFAHSAFNAIGIAILYWLRSMGVV